MLHRVNLLGGILIILSGYLLDPVESLATSLSSSSNCALPPPAKLKLLLEKYSSEEIKTPLLLPCCYDGLTARLVARAGFEATFMTGFGVSGANGYPDAQLVSYNEMVSAANTVAEGLSSVANARYIADESNNMEEELLQMGPIPCIADGDTGYGNAVNVKRTVFGYARAGMAGIMIEDQVAPKRCGHVAGKSVIPFDEAIQRIKAACNARDEYNKLYGEGTAPLILARTDSLVTDGFEDAIQRCIAFRDMGCDMTFLEAPQTVDQMKEYCSRVSGPKLANMLEVSTIINVFLTKVRRGHFYSLIRLTVWLYSSITTS